jgi:signal recognition particle subunit SRP54
MVLNELGSRLTQALASINAAPVIDEKVLDACLKEICAALLQADVNVRLVSELRVGVKKRVNIEQLAAGLNKQRVIEKAVFDELVAMLDSGVADPKKLELKKNRTSVVMFVGLQGSGKTTTCTKYAYFHKRKGWKPALVCADTFRAGAFDQVRCVVVCGGRALMQRRGSLCMWQRAVQLHYTPCLAFSRIVHGPALLVTPGQCA